MKQTHILPQIPQGITDPVVEKYLRDLQKVIRDKHEDDYMSSKRREKNIRIGSSLIFELEYIPISPEFPWFCMSLPTQTLTTANFPQSFIDVLRNKKVVYGELGTSVSAFTGTWSGSEFTLDNNIANVAMIAELAEEWLFEKAMRGGVNPTDGWRILVSNGIEYNITNIVTSTRKITVSGSPSGTSIEIYLNRILGSTTSAKHFSWAGLGLYMTGQNKITGLRRRDKMQRITGNSVTGFISGLIDITYDITNGALRTVSSSKGSPFTGSSNYNISLYFDSANSPDARTGTKTEIEAGTLLVYMYTGGYTA